MGNLLLHVKIPLTSASMQSSSLTGQIHGLRPSKVKTNNILSSKFMRECIRKIFILILSNSFSMNSAINLPILSHMYEVQYIKWTLLQLRGYSFSHVKDLYRDWGDTARVDVGI